MLGDKGLQEETYSNDREEEVDRPFTATNAWLGITDKYWAATLIPDTAAKIDAKFSAGQIGTLKTYQTDYLAPPQTIAPGATGAAERGCSPAPRKSRSSTATTTRCSSTASSC